MKTIHRLKEIIDEKKINVRQLEILIGTANGTIGKALQRESDISSGWLEKILEKFPEISADWLLLGTGQRYKNVFPIPNFVHRNMNYLAQNIIPYSGIENFGTKAGLTYSRARSIITQPFILPTTEELERIAIAFNISPEHLIQQDITKLNFNIDQSTYPEVYMWEIESTDNVKIKELEVELRDANETIKMLLREKLNYERIVQNRDTQMNENEKGEGNGEENQSKAV